MSEAIFERRSVISAPAGGQSSYAVRTDAGEQDAIGTSPPSFTIHIRSRGDWDRLQRTSTYRAGMHFVHGDFDIRGNLLDALRWWVTRDRRPAFTERLLGAISTVRPRLWLQTFGQARRNIHFHYDRSNEFYRQFLDRRMVYSCAYFDHSGRSLDDAQLAKLDHVCHKLEIEAGDRLLDIGCGWGALVLHAAGTYGATAVGCTLSEQQRDYADDEIRRQRLSAQVTVGQSDYRNVAGTFEKVASIGMFEHVGRRRLATYFQKVHDLLTDEGLFLNHGILRPSSTMRDSGSLFLQRCVFPGSDLVSLAEIVSTAERTGFEVLDVENIRPHYALTAAAWVARLQERRDACLAIVDPETYRTWLLYLAGTAVGFERGDVEVSQVLMAKRSTRARRSLTRAHVYRDTAPQRLRFTSAGPQAVDRTP